MTQFFDNLLEFFFVLIGLQLMYTAFKTAKDTSNSKRMGSTIFWLDLGLLFMFGKVLPSVVSGLLVVLLGIITLFKQFEISQFTPVKAEVLESRAKKFGNWIFVPVLSLAVVSVGLAMKIEASSKSAI
ncbi:MAG: DUF979 family protein, partial [Vagococcus sp.]|nr:DUF979 family protein [Vagococcus sp.]